MTAILWWLWLALGLLILAWGLHLCLDASARCLDDLIEKWKDKNNGQR